MTYPEDDRRPYGSHDEGPVTHGDFDVPAEHPADDYGTYDGAGETQAGAGDGVGADVGADTAVGDGDSTDKAGTVLMAALIALAAVASVVMLFATSTAWMKIGVLAGLWAAVIGALLVARYRRQLAAERGRIADLELRHELELDRELATHREQELILEQNYLDSLESRDDDTIAQLRAEIVALREHLAELLGQDLDDERIALRARAERLRELDSPQKAGPPLKDPVAHDRPTPRAAVHRAQATASGRVGTHTTHGPVGVGRERYDDPVDVPVVDNGFADAAPTDEPEEGTAAAGTAAGVPGHTTGGGFHSGSFRAVPWEQAPAGAESDMDFAGTDFDDRADADAATADVDSSPEPDQEWATDGGAEPGRGPQAETAPAPDAAESRPTAVLPRIGDEADAADAADNAAAEASDDADAADDADDAAAEASEAEAPRRARGRRRAEDHEDGLTVAELLAQMRARKQAEERD